MQKKYFNPLIGYRRDFVNKTTLGIVNESLFFETKQRAFEEKKDTVQSINEKILYQKKIDDLHLGILDAINIRSEGHFYPTPINSVTPNVFARHSLRYRRFNRDFYADFIRDADISLGRNIANLYIINNKYAIDMVKDLAFRGNPPTELEMAINGFLRKPEYKQKYSLLLIEMNNIWNDLATRRLTPELAESVKCRTERCKEQAKILNRNPKYLLSVEDRFKKHYAPCGPGIAELAIAELYKENGSDPIPPLSQSGYSHLSKMKNSFIHEVNGNRSAVVMA